MIENILNIMHIGPLVAIAALILGNVLTKSDFFKQDIYNVMLLVLSSLGIASGSFVHHHEAIALIDPCFAYAATLMFVAVRIMAKPAQASSK